MSRSVERSGAGGGVIRVASRSHVGQVREENQDRFGAWSAPVSGRELLLVADGMGGHRGGSRASQLAIDEIGDWFARENGATAVELLRESFARANRRIFEEARADVSLLGMGTTGVALLFESASAAWVAHVGDSRAYRMRDGRLEQLTEDHNLMTELMSHAGMSAREAAAHPASQSLLRALGPSEDVAVEVRPVSIRAGDVFLLCSDGLYGPVADHEIAEIVRRPPGERVADALIDAANLRGGPDNVTVQLAWVEPPPAVEAGRAPASDDPARVGSDRARARGTRRARRSIALAALAAMVTALALGALFVPPEWIGWQR